MTAPMSKRVRVVARPYRMSRWRRAALVVVSMVCAGVVLLMVTDRSPAPQQQQRTTKERVPFTIDGVDGFVCDVEVSTNGDEPDTAWATCDREVP